MKTIYLDLTNCKYWDDLHERIRVAFDFPEWYGKNWNAFWDLLSKDSDAEKVIITGEYSMPREFDEQLAIMHEVLNNMVEECKSEHSIPFSYEIRS